VGETERNSGRNCSVEEIKCDSGRDASVGETERDSGGDFRNLSFADHVLHFRNLFRSNLSKMHDMIREQSARD